MATLGEAKMLSEFDFMGADCVSLFDVCDVGSAMRERESEARNDFFG